MKIALSLRILFVGIACFFLGCTSTSIEFSKLDTNYIRLASMNRKQIGIRLEKLSSKPLSVGNQYLLVAIPFGNVELKNLKEDTESAIFEGLAERGYRPVPTVGTQLPPIELLVEEPQVQVSAYDFLFVRRIVADIKLRARYLNRSLQLNVPLESQGYSSHYRSFGFKPQLEVDFHSAMREAVSKLVKQLPA